ALRGPRSGARGAGRRRRRRSPPALLTAAQRRWAAGGLALGVLALSGPRAQTQSRSAVPVAIVYGGDATFAPYEYVDAQGTARGFNVELIRALGKEAGVG